MCVRHTTHNEWKVNNSWQGRGASKRLMSSNYYTKYKFLEIKSSFIVVVNALFYPYPLIHSSLLLLLLLYYYLPISNPASFCFTWTTFLTCPFHLVLTLTRVKMERHRSKLRKRLMKIVNDSHRSWQLGFLWW